ncbi:hypothetical protein PR202_ga03875 [Eleusine coracana subsp. coracana]|uniref:Uncharacterized protein n=1 Tax=Eleusine coracana subsp. coracana TaxID=191504 RepID=A0AAV5BPQ8_ELECO|nr:hypothetical protein PR202_ga03875 [Eleusine coracana subsp. coracana]
MGSGEDAGRLPRAADAAVGRLASEADATLQAWRAHLVDAAGSWLPCWIAAKRLLVEASSPYLQARS